MAILTRDQILAAEDIKTEVVKVPGWGGEVIVKTMSGFERDKFEEQCTGKNGGKNLANIRAKFAASVIVNEDGELIFSVGDIAKLGKKSADSLDRVLEVGQRLNHFTDSDIEELAKNSQADPSEDTVSD